MADLNVEYFVEQFEFFFFLSTCMYKHKQEDP